MLLELFLIIALVPILMVYINVIREDFGKPSIKFF